MPRLTAWVVILATAGLVFSLVFSTYEHFSGSWETTDSGGLVKVMVECPPPFEVLFMSAEPDGLGQPGFCAPSSRTLALEAGLIAVAALLVVWKPITRARPTPIGTISDKIDVNPGP